MSNTTITSSELIALILNMGYNEQYLFFQRAAELSNTKLCQICLDAGLDINMKEGMYGRPLLVSLMSKPITLTIEVADWFLKNGYDINLASAAGHTPLGYACCYGNYTLAKFFLEHNAHIRSGPNVQFTGDLYDAVKACNTYEQGIKIVHLLLDYGAPLDSDEYPTRNPFVCAIESKQSEVVELFLKRNANPNIYIYGQSALHTAVVLDDICTARLLLEYQANVNAKIKTKSNCFERYYAITPLDIAIYNQNLLMRDLLIQHGAKPSAKEEKIAMALSLYDGDTGLKLIEKIMQLQD